MFEQLVAHELAHVWQGLVRRGGIDEAGEPWVHKGGAQALSIAALEGSGVWSAAQAARFKASLHDECTRIETAAAHGKPDTGSRWAYTCGCERFLAYPLDPTELWRRLRAQTERSGAPYSAAMIARVIRARP